MVVVNGKRKFSFFVFFINKKHIFCAIRVKYKQSDIKNVECLIICGWGFCGSSFFFISLICFAAVSE
jgi:hypothetical protein